MKSIQIPAALALLAMCASCVNKHQSTTTTTTTTTTEELTFSSSNPFFAKSTLPYQAPAFDKIKDADFKPAIEEGMKQQQAEIQKIADNAEAPTFENTLVALEKTGDLLNRVSGVFNLVTGANTDPELQKVQEYEAAK
jgi:peptidyl-dipeptidase Dcp